MKLLNEQRNDLSAEMMMQMAIILEMVQAAEIMCYKCARTFDASGYKDTFFQKKKHVLRMLGLILKPTTL